MDIFLFGGALIQILIVVGIISLVVWLFRHRSRSGEDPGIGTLRRFYFYGLAFAALMVAASGAAMLVDEVLDLLFAGDIISRGQNQLALGLAMLLVGAPVWYLHWTLAQRAVARIPWESQAVARRVYIYLVLAVCAVVAAVGMVSLFHWWLSLDSFNGRNLALPLVWGSIWAFHWRLRDSEQSGTVADDVVRQVYLYFSAWYGLAMLSVGVGIVIWRLLLQVYSSWFGGGTLVLGDTGLWTATVVWATATAIVGAIWWWWHWHLIARTDAGSTVRQFYLHLFTILPGAGGVFVYSTILLYRAIQWGIGQPDVAAYEQFRVIPEAVPGVLVGVALWGYHWAVAHQEASALGSLPHARRIYRYMVTAAGLVVLGAGIIVLLAVGIGGLALINSDVLLGPALWGNSLALAVTLLLVGIPVWAYHWFGVQRDAGTNMEELDHPVRRVFFFGVFGAAVLLVLGNLSAMLFFVLRDLLEGSLSSTILLDGKWSIAMFLTACAAGVYHWSVSKEDRQELETASPEPAPEIPVQPRKLVIAVATQAAQPLISQIEARLGFPIRVWQRLDPEAGEPQLNDEQLDATRDRISAAPGDRVLITLDANGVGVVPFKE